MTNTKPLKSQWGKSEPLQDKIVGQSLINSNPDYIKGKKLYLVFWTYCANFGRVLVYAKNEQEARKSLIFGDKCTFIVTEIDPANMPVIFHGEYE